MYVLVFMYVFFLCMYVYFPHVYLFVCVLVYMHTCCIIFFVCLYACQLFCLGRVWRLRDCVDITAVKISFIQLIIY